MLCMCKGLDHWYDYRHDCSRPVTMAGMWECDLVSLSLYLPDRAGRNTWLR